MPATPLNPQNAATGCGCISPLMSAYNEEVRLWMKNNPGKIVTLYNVRYLLVR
jgi:hypothetical protein